MSCCKSVKEKASAGASKAHNNSKAFQLHNDEYLDLTGKYKLWGPSVKGEAFECFKSGMLYRIEEGNKWAFYNDTQLYEMHVSVSFEPDFKLVNLGNTMCTTEVTDWFVVHTIVYPGETELFCQGMVDLYKCALHPRTLSQTYRKTICDAANININRELSLIKMTSGDSSAILDYCVDNRTLFIDPEFFPCEKSIYRREIDVAELEMVPWIRPRDFLHSYLKNNCKKYTEINPTHIHQGHLGNCWFMCAIAAVAGYQNRIEKLFINPLSTLRIEKEESVGAYRVTLNCNGWWTTVIIDDYLPVIGGKQLYARDHKNPADLWVSLIEKAYAKVHGSYSSISRGDPLSALKDLTGFPITRFDTEWEKSTKNEELSNDLFDTMLKYCEKGYLIMLNTKGSDSCAEHEREFYNNTTLGIGHSYSIADVYYFPTYNLRLFKIRNPWKSTNEWNGKWSNNSQCWEEYVDVKEHCDFFPHEGFLWMEWGDVRTYFIGGGVCFWRRNWHDYRIQGSFNGVVPNVILEVHVTKPVDIFAILSQKDKRGLPDTDPNSKYSGMMLSIARKEGNKFTVDQNSTTDVENPSKKYTFSIARDHALHYTLEPEFSPYLIIPRLYKAREVDKGYVLGLLTDKEVGADFIVKFNTIDPTSKVLDNYAKFAYDPTAQPEKTTDFQYNAYDECPINSTGREIKFAMKKF